MTTSVKAPAESAVKTSIGPVKRRRRATNCAAMERRGQMRSATNGAASERWVPGNYSRSA